MKQKGIFGDVIMKIRLTTRLMGDSRINIFIKIIPFLALVYLIVPLDLMIGPIDDTILIIGAIEVFLKLCPQEIVDEYRKLLQNK